MKLHSILFCSLLTTNLTKCPSDNSLLKFSNSELDTLVVKEDVTHRSLYRRQVVPALKQWRATGQPAAKLIIPGGQYFTILRNVANSDYPCCLPVAHMYEQPDRDRVQQELNTSKLVVAVLYRYSQQQQMLEDVWQQYQRQTAPRAKL